MTTIVGDVEAHQRPELAVLPVSPFHLGDRHKCEHVVRDLGLTGITPASRLSQMRLKAPLAQFPQTLEGVVSEGLCTGCGICSSVVGAEHITMGISPRGDARPRFNRDLTASENRRLIDICPGATAVGPSPSGVDAPIDPIWGPMRALHRGWAAADNVRHHAAAGGTLTALSLFLLDSKRVTAIVHVRASTDHPMLTEAHVSRTREDVLRGAQSRYGPASPLVHIAALLNAGERFAVVGKPCDIAAITNLRQHDTRATSQIPYLLTLFCGGAPTVASAEKIAQSHGISADEVGTFRFRGEGWPGMTHITSTNGTTVELTYAETWLTKGQPWRYDVQWRCKICPDAIGETADLSCPDGWLLDGSGKPMHHEAPGMNAIVVRTQAGSELLEAATSAGYLVTEPLSRTEFDLMHHDHLTRKLGEPARLAALLFGGRARPRIHGYRLLRTAQRSPVRLLIDQFRGTLKRLREHQAREPLLRKEDR